MYRTFFYIAIFFFGWSTVSAQNKSLKSKDSIHQTTFIKKSIVPVSLMTLGVLINHSALEKKIRRNIINKYGTDYGNHIDDYIQFAPVLTMYTADILGVKAKNHWFDQGKYLFFSNALSSTITFYLKKWIGKTRPNGAGYLSFPSGHTTFAFTNATVLYEEFKDSSPILAYSGFGFATTTATFRMINNKHWLSDVLMGAGIGMLSTYIIYHFKPLKNFNPFKKSKNITLLPNIIDNKKGIYFAYRF